MQQNNFEFWIDVYLPPVMAKWIIKDFGISAKSFAELYYNTEDITVFTIAANRFNTVIFTTKDIDLKISPKNLRPNPLLKC
jgi:predicted nuclease of predicted toxin-antitoxin system